MWYPSWGGQVFRIDDFIILIINIYIALLFEMTQGADFYVLHVLYHLVHEVLPYNRIVSYTVVSYTVVSYTVVSYGTEVSYSTVVSQRLCDRVHKSTSSSCNEWYDDKSFNNDSHGKEDFIKYGLDFSILTYLRRVTHYFVVEDFNLIRTKLCMQYRGNIYSSFPTSELLEKHEEILPREQMSS